MSYPKQFSFLALLFFFTAQNGYSQQKSVLFKVQKEGYPNSFVFGTLHMVPEENLVLSEPLKSCLYSCDELVLEADIFSASTDDVMKYGILPNGGHLDTALSHADYELLDAALTESSGVGLLAFNSFKPFMIDATLMASAIPAGSQSWESVLATSKYIVDENKPISFLETIEQQLCFFDSIPVRMQLAQTLDYLKEGEGMEAEYQKLLKLYLVGDVAAIYNYTIENIDDPRYLYFLLEKRNRAWVPNLAEKMRSKSLFVGVGAAHLGGENGILALLRAEGFQVTEWIEID